MLAKSSKPQRLGQRPISVNCADPLTDNPGSKGACVAPPTRPVSVFARVTVFARKPRVLREPFLILSDARADELVCDSRPPRSVAVAAGKDPVLNGPEPGLAALTKGGVPLPLLLGFHAARCPRHRCRSVSRIVIASGTWTASIVGPWVTPQDQLTQDTIMVEANQKTHPNEQPPSVNRPGLRSACLPPQASRHRPHRGARRALPPCRSADIAAAGRRRRKQ